MSATEILAAAKALPLDERIEVAEGLWEDIAGNGYDPDLTPEQIEELERRADRLCRNPQSGIPWEQVCAELPERLKNRNLSAWLLFSTARENPVGSAAD